jgi:hypothetical protein
LSFQDILKEQEVSSQHSRSQLYSQGGEAAEGFFLGMLSESMTFSKAELPMALPMSTEVRFAFQHMLFGKEERQRRLTM